MSEYQYYEFLAIDKPLSSADMKWLRSLSTRAEITPTSLVNTYHWGDFKGDPVKLMKRCFDAHVYVSNFGFSRFMVKLPRKSVTLRTVQAYDQEYGLSVTSTESIVLLDFRWEDEAGDWDFDDDGTNLMASLAPLRNEIMLGDNRALYLGWLFNVDYGTVVESDVEPPLPPGLRSLTAPQRALMEFLRLDPQLVAAAAEHSEPKADSELSAKDIRDYVKMLPPAKRDPLVNGHLLCKDPQLRLKTLRQIVKARSAAQTPASAPRKKRRSVAQLSRAWHERDESR